jgi:hypothetical protein
MRRHASAHGHAFLADIATSAVPDRLGRRRHPSASRTPAIGEPGGLRQRAARRPLHRRRRPRQREHRPDRRAPRLPCRAQPAGRSTPRNVLIRRTRLPQRVARRSLCRAAPTTPAGAALVWDGERCSRPPSSAPRCSISTWCSRSSPARSSPTSTSSGARRLSTSTINPVDRRRVRPCGLPLRPLDADRDDRPVRPDLHADITSA